MKNLLTNLHKVGKWPLRFYSLPVNSPKFLVAGSSNMVYGPRAHRKIDSFLTEYKQFDSDDKSMETHFKIEGTSWTEDALREKSWNDLHNLWFVLLREKNMLLTMKAEILYRLNFREMKGTKLYEPSKNAKLEKSHNLIKRLAMVKESMNNIIKVLGDRKNSWLGAKEMWEMKEKGLDPLKPEILEKINLRNQVKSRLQKFHKSYKFAYLGKYINKRVLRPVGYELVKDINAVRDNSGSDTFHVQPSDEHREKRYDLDYTPIKNRRHKSRRKIRKFREYTREY